MSFASNHPLGQVDAWYEDPRSCGFAPALERERPLEELAIDPRLTSIIALRGARVTHVLFSYACHATALGRTFHEYHRDLPGFAVDALNWGLSGVSASMLQAGGADVSPVPPPAPTQRSRRAASEDHARRIGEGVADAVASDVDWIGSNVPRGLAIARERGQGGSCRRTMARVRLDARTTTVVLW